MSYELFKNLAAYCISLALFALEKKGCRPRRSTPPGTAGEKKNKNAEPPAPPARFCFYFVGLHFYCISRRFSVLRKWSSKPPTKRFVLPNSKMFYQKNGEKSHVVFS